MMRSMTLTAALGLTLLLAGCGTDSTPTAGSGAETTDGARTTADAAAPMDDQVCAGFFQNVPVTLAERADAAREALEAGTVADPASWGEVNLLKQRVEQLVARGDTDQAALLERVNAPFVEASAAVLDDPEQKPTDPEITVPQIDVADSAAAQDELLAACSG